MKTFAIAFLMTATSAFAGITFSNTADIAKENTNVKIWDAKYFLEASKTEVRQIPNCGGEQYPCTEVVVLERQPVVKVTVSFNNYRQDPENTEGSIVLNLDPASFSADKVETLKAASQSVWDLSGKNFRARAAWVKSNLVLQNKVVTRTIQVVDVSRSHLCVPQGESSEPAPGCVEHVEYKPATTVVREVTVLVK